jgi:hypothetical protein
LREKSRNTPLSIVLGTAAVILLYLFANPACLKLLPLSRISATEQSSRRRCRTKDVHIGATLVAVTKSAKILELIGRPQGGEPG